MERHEEMIEQNSCAICSLTLKRRSDLAKHIRLKHSDIEPSEGFGPVHFQANKQFIDPYPLSWDLIVFSKM